MKRLLRTVLIWLVALAIPAQGMAAVAMLHCGPGHHPAQKAGATATLLPEVAHAEHAAHGHVGHRVQGSDAATSAAASADVQGVSAAATAADTAADSASDADPSTQAPNQKCSACAACCAGLALPSAVALLPTLDPVREVTVLSPSWTAGVAVDGLERPPRILRV